MTMQGEHATQLAFEDAERVVSTIRVQGGSRVLSVTRSLPGEWETVSVASVRLDDDRYMLLIKRLDV